MLHHAQLGVLARILITTGPLRQPGGCSRCVSKRQLPHCITAPQTSDATKCDWKTVLRHCSTDCRRHIQLVGHNCIMFFRLQNRFRGNLECAVQLSLCLSADTHV